MRRRFALLMPAPLTSPAVTAVAQSDVAQPLAALHPLLGGMGAAGSAPARATPRITLLLHTRRRDHCRDVLQ